MSDVFRLKPVDSGRKRPPRGRSTISFPYYDLAQSERLAKEVWSSAGKCKPEQLAAWLGHKTLNSGAFRNRVSAASLFGLVVSSRKQIALSELGRRIVDPDHAASARAEAFLSVPLYGLLYEDHRGIRLSPAILLEQKMIEYGVTRTQSRTARQVFMRAAEQAGFFEVSDNRLVEPRLAGKVAVAPAMPSSPVAPAGEGGYPPLIAAVLAQAPWGEGWDEESFGGWSDLFLRAARMHFKLPPNSS